MRSDKSPPTLDSYLALLQSYEAKKKYDVVFHLIFEIKTNVFYSGTTFRPSRRCFPSSIRVPKIASLRTVNVYDDTRSLRKGGGTFENGYIEPTMRWRRSDGYFKMRSGHPAKAGQLAPRPHLGREVRSRRKGPRRPSLHSGSWRRNSGALPNSSHPYQLRPPYPRPIGNRPRSRLARYGQDLLSFSAARVRNRQLQSAQVTNTPRV